MKIIVTRDEIKKLIAQKLILEMSSFVLVISDEKKKTKKKNENQLTKIPLLDKLIARLKEKEVFSQSNTHMIFAFNKKLEAIREVDQFYIDNGVSCGLATAKTIVEEWDTFVKHCYKIKGFIINPCALSWREELLWPD